MITFVFLVVFLNLSTIEGNFDPSKIDYCKLPCPRRTTENTACKCYKDDDYLEIYFDIVAFRKEILEIHNELRNRVGTGTEKRIKSAANMNALSYDLELEYMARCHALKTGGFSDDSECRRTSKFEEPGQIAKAYEKHPNISETVEVTWYDRRLTKFEHININPYNKSYRSVELERLSEFLWWSHTHIGCAMIYSKQRNFEPRVRLVCDYGGTGPTLINNMTVYKEGKGCSKCPTGVKCNSKYLGLCGEISPIPTEELVPIVKKKFTGFIKNPDFNFTMDDFNKNGALSIGITIKILLATLTTILLVLH